MVGSSIFKKLKKKNFKIIVADKKKLNLLDQRDVNKFLKLHKPNGVIIAAGRVGGIYANSENKYNFLYENLQIQNNIINSSFEQGVKNLLFLGSSCIYPKNSKQPIKENYLLTGKLEETNDAYALAKIAGLKLCQYLNEKYNLNYKTLMPNNLYGPNDNYDTKNSHFIAALIKKVVYAIKHKKNYVEMWGSGKPLRELMFVDDLADASITFLNKKTKETVINIGSGIEYTIMEYLKEIIRYFNVNIKIKINTKMPDGMYRKKLDLKIAKKYGWKAKYSLKKGLDITIKDYLSTNKIVL